MELLYTGQPWYPDLGLYDLRNRFYKADWGRFLQPDPIGFAGDPANLYRYCGNNPVNWSDPTGTAPAKTSDGTGAFTPLGSHIPIASGRSLGNAANFPSGYASTNGWGSVSGGEAGAGGHGSGGGATMGWTYPDTVEVERIFVVGKPVTVLDGVIEALERWAPYVRQFHVEVGGYVKKNGEITVGPPDRRTARTNYPGPWSPDIAAIWHWHQLLPPNPYQFSTGPYGTYGGDLVYLTEHGNVPQYIGILNAPPGQEYTMIAHLPGSDAPFIFIQWGPGLIPPPKE